MKFYNINIYVFTFLPRFVLGINIFIYVFCNDNVNWLQWNNDALHWVNFSARLNLSHHSIPWGRTILEKLMFAQLAKKLYVFVETEILLPCIQQYNLQLHT